MNEETKKYLLLGGGLVAAVIVGIIVYKKYQAGGQAGSAAADQSTADQMAYLESLSMASPYQTVGGGSSSAIAAPTAPAMPSIAEEIASIEQAFGLTTPTSAPGSSATGSGASATPSAPSGSQPKREPVPVVPAGKFTATNWQSEELPYLKQEGVLVA